MNYSSITLGAGQVVQSMGRPYELNRTFSMNVATEIAESVVIGTILLFSGGFGTIFPLYLCNLQREVSV